MGSYVLETLKKQQIEEAITKKNHSVVENLLLQFGFSDEQAADVAEVSITFHRALLYHAGQKKGCEPSSTITTNLLH